MRHALTAIALCGCAIDDRLLVQVPVVAGGAEEASFEATDGGTVTLDAATVTFADLRLEEPASTDTLAALYALIVPVAQAHPGHDYPGDVAGELLGSFTVDLLAPDAEIGVASCYEGAYATGRVRLASVSLSGVHTDPAGVETPFAFDLALDQDIIGIPFATTLSAAGPPAAIDVRFDPAVALAHVDWTASRAGDIATTDDEIYGNTVRFGVLATPAWALEESR